MSEEGCVLRFPSRLPQEQFFRNIPCSPPVLRDRMKALICRCCGEPMPEQGNALSRNPNICASCSSMTDGMDDTALPPATQAEADTPTDRVPPNIEADAAE